MSSDKVAYIPEHNGIAKRYNKTVMERAYAMIEKVNLNNKY